MHLNDLIRGVLRRDFPKILKNYRDMIFMKSNHLYPYEDWDESDFGGLDMFVRITDIGQIFNYNYCFFWEEEEISDIDYSHIEVNDISYELENEFKDTLNRLLDVYDNNYEVEPVLKEEVLLSMSGSVCFEKEKYVFEAKEQESKNKFSHGPLVGKRSLIRVSPANQRDTIILPVDQSNTIKWIELNCKQIAEKILGSAYVENKEDFNYICDEFFDRHTFFLDRDFKKEGLTKPRELIRFVKDVLVERYPEIEAFHFLDIYDDFSYIDTDGKKKSTKRGHGLGMANALTTIIQSVLFHMVLERLSYEVDFEEEDISCLIFNDDFTVGFKEDYILEEYWDIEDELFDKLSIIRNKKKSRRGSNSFSFCERYYPESFNEKNSYKLNEFFIPFTMPNISVAKMMYNNLSRCEDIPYTKKRVLEELVSFFGHEFFLGEEELPFCFGGWVTPSFNQVDLSHCVITELDFDKLPARAALEASTVGIYNRNKIKGRKYKSPLYQITRTEDIFIPDEFSLVFMTDKSINEVRDLFGNRNNPNHLSNSMARFFEMRSFVFEKHSKDSNLEKNLVSIFRRMSQIYPEKDFLPNLKIQRKVPLALDFRERIKLPKIRNKNLSMVKYFNPDKIKLKGILPLIYPMDEITKRRDKAITTSMYGSCELFRKDSELEIQTEFNFRDIHIPDDILSDNRIYHNPHLIVESNFYINGEVCFPDVPLFEDVEKFKFTDDPILLEILKSPEQLNVFKILYEKSDDLEDSIKKTRYLYEGLQEFPEIDFEINQSKLVPEQPEEIPKPKVALTTRYGVCDYVLWKSDNSPQDDVEFEDRHAFTILDKSLNYHRFMSDFDEHQCFLLSEEESSYLDPYLGLLELSGVSHMRSKDSGLIERIWIQSSEPDSSCDESSEGFNADDFMDEDFG